MEVHGNSHHSSSSSSLSNHLDHHRHKAALGKADDGVEGSTSAAGYLVSDDDHVSNSDMSLYHSDGNDNDDEEEEEEEEEDDDDLYDYDYCDSMFDDNSDGEKKKGDDEYSKMQAQFDNVDLPTGVEASVPDIAMLDSKTCAALSGSSATISSSNTTEEAEKELEVEQKYLTFKRFDIVDDFSDHHYRKIAASRLPTQVWTKKIQDEWKILENNLPETIYVRVYEGRMDLLRAVIIGPTGTPYHDGLFFFDVHFPPGYPAIPPEVYYHSGGLRINPNLYNCGKVCLSLLNTWSGRLEEKWLPNKSTMLQVLVSIQALILNAKPFFNEPGYARLTGAEGARRSKQYNEDIFVLSLKTMIYTLNRPPKHFEDFVSGHFRIWGRAILYACRAYIEETEVGSDVIGEKSNSSKIEKSKLKGFKSNLATVMNGLVESFTRNGNECCKEFALQH